MAQDFTFLYDNKSKYKNGLMCKPPAEGFGRKEGTNKTNVYEG